MSCERNWRWNLKLGTGSSVCLFVFSFALLLLLLLLLVVKFLHFDSLKWLQQVRYTHRYNTHTHVYNNWQDQTHNGVQLPAFIGHLPPLLLVVSCRLLVVGVAINCSLVVACHSTATNPLTLKLWLYSTRRGNYDFNRILSAWVINV